MIVIFLDNMTSKFSERHLKFLRKKKKYIYLDFYDISYSEK